MRTIQLTDAHLVPADDLVGRYLDRSHYDRVVRDTCTVLKPDGTPLLIYVKDALPRSLCRVAFDVFKRVDFTTDNRGYASGGSRIARSGIVGYYTRYPTIPYCRMTAFNLDHERQFERARPFFGAINRLFRKLAPERWEAQRQFVEGISKDFVIKGTVFTTVTVNQTWRTAAHRDKEDYAPGMGVMAVLEGGRYEGCELIFPRYRTAVDMRTGGLCLADVHEVHGNAPLVGLPGQYRRLSFVLYARTKMTECGTAEEEHERAVTMVGRGSDLEAL